MSRKRLVLKQAACPNCGQSKPAERILSNLFATCHMWGCEAAHICIPGAKTVDNYRETVDNLYKLGRKDSTRFLLPPIYGFRCCAPRIFPWHKYSKRNRPFALLISPASMHSRAVEKPCQAYPHMHGEPQPPHLISKVDFSTRQTYPHIHRPYYDYYIL
jgi:hypothetical protein